MSFSFDSFDVILSALCTDSRERERVETISPQLRPKKVALVCIQFCSCAQFTICVGPGAYSWRKCSLQNDVVLGKKFETTDTALSCVSDGSKSSPTFSLPTALSPFFQKFLSLSPFFFLLLFYCFIFLMGFMDLFGFCFFMYIYFFKIGTFVVVGFELRSITLSYRNVMRERE